MSDTPETDAKCPYCKAMPMGMIAKVRWTCGSYGGSTGRSESCKERASAWDQRDDALRERDEAREKYDTLAVENMLEVNKLCKERDEAREALMQIEDLFIDGTDIYADRENMGIIARNALKGAQ